MPAPTPPANAPTCAGTRLPGTPEPMRYWTGSSGNRLAGDYWGDRNGPLVVLQHGGVVVGPRRAPERAPDRARVHFARIGGRERRLSPRQESPASRW